MSDARAEHIVMETEGFLLSELVAEDADDLLEALGDPEAAVVAERVGMWAWKPVDHRGIPHVAYSIGGEEWSPNDGTA